MKLIFDKYTNDACRFMDVNGHKIHYRDEGTGFPILLIHGTFSSLHTFDAWAEDFKKDYRVIRYTLPGFGLSGPNAQSDYTVASHLFYADFLMTKLGINRFHIAGSSLGGWIAWEYALRHPEKVDKMILIGAAGYINDQNVPLPFRMARTPFLNRVVKYAIQRNVLEMFLRQVYFDQRKVTDYLVDRYYELFSLQGNPEAFLHLVNGKIKDNSHNIKKIQAPTLVLWGEEDRWLPVENAYRFINDLPEGKLIVYEKTGHVPMEEIPKTTATDVRHFLIHGTE